MNSLGYKIVSDILSESFLSPAARSMRSGALLGSMYKRMGATSANTMMGSAPTPRAYQLMMRQKKLMTKIADPTRAANIKAGMRKTNPSLASDMM